MKPENYDPEEDHDEDEVALLDDLPLDVEQPRRGRIVMMPDRKPSDIDEVTKTGMATCLNDDDMIQRWKRTRMPDDRKSRTVLLVAFAAYEAGDCVTMRLILRTQLKEGAGT